METRAIALRSPAVMSMSISRPGRMSDTSPARRSSSSVSLPMADTTSTTSSPRRRQRATWSATSRMRSGSATDVPPNFWTRSATARNGTSGAEAPLNPDSGRSPAHAPPGSLRSAAVGTNAEKHARQKERRSRVDEARRQVEREGAPAPHR